MARKLRGSFLYLSYMFNFLLLMPHVSRLVTNTTGTADHHGLEEETVLPTPVSDGQQRTEAAVEADFETQVINQPAPEFESIFIHRGCAHDGHRSGGSPSPKAADHKLLSYHKLITQLLECVIHDCIK